jgi:hypothetical protein
VRRAAKSRGSYRKPEDEGLLPLVRRLVNERPTYGYRRIAALANRELAKKGEPPVNHKRVFRIMRQNGMLLTKHTGRRIGRVHDCKVVVMRSNLRWCSDGFEITAGTASLSASPCRFNNAMFDRLVRRRTGLGCRRIPAQLGSVHCCRGLALPTVDRLRKPLIIPFVFGEQIDQTWLVCSPVQWLLRPASSFLPARMLPAPQNKSPPITPHLPPPRMPQGGSSDIRGLVAAAAKPRCKSAILDEMGIQREERPADFQRFAKSNFLIPHRRRVR